MSISIWEKRKQRPNANWLDLQDGQEPDLQIENAWKLKLNLPLSEWPQECHLSVSQLECFLRGCNLYSQFDCNLDTSHKGCVLLRDVWLIFSAGFVGSGPLVLLIEVADRIGPNPAKAQQILLYTIAAFFTCTGRYSTLSVPAALSAQIYSLSFPF